MAETRTHYTAHVQIKRVTRRFTATQSLARGQTETLSNREVEDVANLSFTASNVEDLGAKVAAHIALIEDGEA